MARVFAITTDRDTVQLDLEGKGEIAFTVTNSTERSLRGSAKISPQDSTKADWFSIAGEMERDYPPKATQQVAVKIAVPPGTPAGKYPFRLIVSSTANPNDDYGEGPLVVFESVEIKKPFPWWIIAAIIAVALIGGAVAAYLLIPKKVDVPNVINQPRKEAKEKITARGLNYEETPIENPNVKEEREEKVLEQEPSEGRIAKGGIIKLTVQVPVPPFAMPDFASTGKNIKEAEEFFSDKYVKLQKTTQATDSQTEGKILAQTPEKGKQLYPGDTVTLTFAIPLVPFPMPQVVGVNKQIDVAQTELENQGLRVTKNDGLDPGVAQGVVIAQSPHAGVMVKSGDPVTLTEAYTLVNIPFTSYATWSIARDRLNDAGLYASSVHGDCTSPVNRSEPPYNTPVKKGTGVVLYTGGDPNRECWRGYFGRYIVPVVKGQLRERPRQP